LDEEFNIKTYQDGEFFIQAKDSYAQRHFFVDEELQSSPEASPSKQPRETLLEDAPQVQVIDSEDDLMPIETFKDLEEVKDEFSTHLSELGATPKVDSL
jgi:hypothetical protein